MAGEVRGRVRPGVDADPAGAVDDYLADRFHIGLEATLLNAARSALPGALGGVVVPALAVLNSTIHLGGGISKIYGGTIEIVGVTYAAEFEVWTDVDGYGFIIDIGRFEPLEWRAHLRLENRDQGRG